MTPVTVQSIIVQSMFHASQVSLVHLLQHSSLTSNYHVTSKTLLPLRVTGSTHEDNTTQEQRFKYHQLTFLILHSAAMSTGIDTHRNFLQLKQRLARSGNTDAELEDVISKTLTLNLEGQAANATPDTAKTQLKLPQAGSVYNLAVYVLSPILLTALSAFLRLYKIGAAKSVVWDEAHFGKFGSHYLQHEFYFDVHPPMGKLLVGLSGLLAGYDGSFDFNSGTAYPPSCNYLPMRYFNAVFGILCTPIAYFTSISCGFNLNTVWLITLGVTFEMLAMTLAKFILLDSMLLFFTVLSFYCLVVYHNLRVQDRLLSYAGILWLAFTGVVIGCVCSVKWVGLFITVVLGLYTVYDLFIKFCQVSEPKDSASRISVAAYLAHWVVRVVTLIMIPFTIYLACFKIHFLILNKSGTGDSSVSTLLQASFEDSKIVNGPRSVAYGSLVTLRSHGLSPNLLHSHGHRYPEGSRQQQVTTYGYKDNNNEWLFEFPEQAGLLATVEPEDNATDISYLQRYLVHGDTVRLVHKETNGLLHSHDIAAFISTSSSEVSCFTTLEASDAKDEWVIEVEQQQPSPDSYFDHESDDEIHPVSTNFRLKHKVLGCYLATSGYNYPSWGFGQGEVICKYSFVGGDKTTWWNVEDHINDALPAPEREYVAPKPRFWKEFIMINYSMMSSNNALVPDKDKFDLLASEWWQWPIAQVGLRMGSWGTYSVKYFLVAHPVLAWGSTAALALFVVYSFILLLLWQRQVIHLPGGIFDPSFQKFLIQGILPFLAWVFNFYPFIAMGRVTYVHHYVPALYFGIFVMGFMVEQLSIKLPRVLKWALYLAVDFAIVGGFYYLRHLSFGMEGPSHDFNHLRVLKTWMV